MAQNKADRRAKQAKRKEAKRRKSRMQERKSVERANESRLEVRLAKQYAVAWQGEWPEDVALFDDAVLAKLPAELQTEAKLVRQAFDQACEGKSSLGIEQLAAIPRRSPFAEWKIFLRGFECWHQGKLAEAKVAWERLDHSRRAWRMAAALLLAHSENLSEIRHQGLAKYREQSETNDPWLTNADDQLLLHAKMVRQTQIDRASLREALAVTKINDPDVPDATVITEHIEWLKEFTLKYRTVDPGLVQALHQTCVARAFAGSYIDVFRKCAESFQGPPHDRRNLLAKACFGIGHDPIKKVNDDFAVYLRDDLSQNKSLPKPLQSALTSLVYCQMAASEAAVGMDQESPFSFFGPTPDTAAILTYFEKSLAAYPANRNAYEGYETIIRDKLSDDYLLAAGRAELQQELADIQIRRLEHLPDDIETRLELVDYLLESGRSDLAETHVHWLAGTPRENPLADAMMWKWNLLEAMRLCRRKATISSTTKHLDAAEEEWPQWLSRDWLPYLRAAAKLRGGESRAFEEMPSQDRVSSKVADACMRLGAAQKMSVEAASLKPIRKALDGLLSSLKTIPLSDLISAAGFFWDLHRTRLKYPAYRMHGTKLLKRIMELVDAQPELVTEHLGDRPIQTALLIMANESLFNGDNGPRFPDWIEADRPHDSPIINAVIASAVSRSKYLGGKSFEPFADALRAAAETASGMDDRYLFKSLANQVDSKIEEMGKFGMGRLSGMFSQIQSMFEGDEDDYDDDYDADYDDGSSCMCPACRLKRGEL